MSKKACLFIMLFTVNCVTAQTSVALQPGWKATLTVVDEASRPIVGANVEVWYYVPPPPGKTEASAKIQGLTDTNGVFVASHQDRSEDLAIHCKKPGYYLSRTQYHLGFQPDPARRSFTQTIVLKKIGQPIPMYARNAQIEIPKTGKPVGFDLVEGDWVAPYGKGKQGDFIFQAERRWVSRNDFDSAIKLTFSNPGDGLIPVLVPSDQGSELRLSAVAPSDGYNSELSKSLSHTPANGWKKDENTEQNYYFRVRTVLGDRGKVKSSLYGKIHGDFALDPINSKTTWILFTYYLNPTPNSRNVEFDPKRNLMKNLKPLEGVEAP